MTGRLQHSFGAVYALFERPRAARCTVAVLLVIHSLLLAYSAYVHSPTLNEPGHLVACLFHRKFGQFDIYNRNQCGLQRRVVHVIALPVLPTND